MSEHDFLYKVVAVGAPNVGKTSMSRRFVENMFTDDYALTIGVNFFTRTIVHDINGIRKQIKLQIWDTAGQERFQSTVTGYYRGAAIVMLTFALDDLGTFEGLASIWLPQVKKHCDEKLEIRVLVGNKCDRPREVSLERAKAFAAENDMEYVETSAKTGEMIEEIFIKTAVDLATRHSVSLLDNKRGGDFVHIQKEDEEKQENQSRKCCGGT